MEIKNIQDVNRLEDELLYLIKKIEIDLVYENRYTIRQSSFYRKYIKQCEKNLTKGFLALRQAMLPYKEMKETINKHLSEKGEK